jgi:hypothetical protein
MTDKSLGCRFYMEFTLQEGDNKMESTLSIPTPKTPRKQCSRDDRLRVQTLYFDAGWTQDQIIPKNTPLALRSSLILQQGSA